MHVYMSLLNDDRYLHAIVANIYKWHNKILFSRHLSVTICTQIRLFDFTWLLTSILHTTVYDTLYFMHSIENSGRVQTVPSSFIFTLWKPRNERNGACVKRSGLRGKGSAGPQKRPTVMKELNSNWQDFSTPWRPERWSKFQRKTQLHKTLKHCDTIHLTEVNREILDLRPNSLSTLPFHWQLTLVYNLYKWDGCSRNVTFQPVSPTVNSGSFSGGIVACVYDGTFPTAVSYCGVRL